LLQEIDIIHGLTEIMIREKTKGFLNFLLLSILIIALAGRSGGIVIRIESLAVLSSAKVPLLPWEERITIKTLFQK
jgi:hypothetical protein